jgi:hydrogenase maturation protein HypF
VGEVTKGAPEPRRGDRLTSPPERREGRRITVTGTVQGVGFRPFVYRAARDAGVGGRVWNDAAGVTVEAFGTADALDALVRTLRRDHPPAAVVATLRSEPIPAEAAPAFEIVGSAGGAERRAAIPPDLATCPACLAELRDPADRRHRYPFTNCTACGPRFTIALGAPYDRPRTTMAGFTLCAACAREYGDPGDRRFHAQPNACPACGPRVALRDAAGSPVEAADPIAAVGRALAAGAVAAVKGLGGYHLACDATSPAAVATLRARKRREEKPLAVMVADLEAARVVAELTAAEEALLASVERPIVLCRRRPGAPLAAEVAPDSPLVGLLLPYAPLHHLLLEAAGRPLVMTSGNLSEEPIAFEDEEAVRRLAGVADLFLVHDRPIASRCDDSVARVVAGGPLLLRRARGFVPRPVRVPRPFARPVLAVGGQLKNACCLGRGDEATLGPHVGDLDGLETYGAFEAAIARLEEFLALRPEVVACDLHPLYLSTRYARERAAALRAPLVGVQHHHAHAAAAMAEHGLEGPVLALAWDGTGLGTDGAAWGGELLLAERARFERLATFRPIALAGGDRAIREPWRIALAALLDAFGEDAPLDRLPLFAAVDPKELAVVRRMIAGGVNAPLAHGAGRAFDAAGALALRRPSSRYEGQVATALDAAAAAGGEGAYPFAVDEQGAVAELDLRPLWRALAGDLLAGANAAVVSARFHASLVAAGAELVRRAARRVGRLPVVLAGGCFQNARLVEGLLGELSGAFAVYPPREVPPGDGGLALGQAIVADARAR